MEAVTKYRSRSRLTEFKHRHRGDRRVLVPDGAGAWRYYMLTPTQAKFWQGLSAAERKLLARIGGRGCFVCALRDVVERQERFESGLHRALMSFLLLPPT